MDQADLFPEDLSHAPLAARMRPRSFDEFAGQGHLVAPDAAFRRRLGVGAPPSVILWGPPGSGKTTLARLIAGASGARLVSLSGVSSGVADLRREVAEAERRRAASGERTVLFVDEIHRFNRTQQDALLPHVEAGSVSLIGATTENPSFSVNSPLLSRSQVLALRALGDQEMRQIVVSALADPERGLAARATISEEGLATLLRLAGGDARSALNILESAALAGPANAVIESTHLEAAAQRTLIHDRAGDNHFWVISAYIKSIRSSDPDAAVYWLARLLEAGEDPMFVARRLVIASSEDVGLAEPTALLVAQSAMQATAMIGMPECLYPLASATIYLAMAPKSNAAGVAYHAAAADVRNLGSLPVPLHLRNAVTSFDRGQGFGQGYAYSHEDEAGALSQQHLPDRLVGRSYYQASGNGREPELMRRLQELRRRLSPASGLD